MGLVAGRFYAIYAVNRDMQSIVNLAYAYAMLMHYMHRGVLAPYYFFLFIMINGMFYVSRTKKE